MRRIYLVTRHPGALDWLREQGYGDAQHISHLEPLEIEPGDTVIGTLPVNLVADLCARGAEYLHLRLDLPEHLRGRDLSADELTQLGARLEGYIARPVPHKPVWIGDRP